MGHVTSFTVNSVLNVNVEICVLLPLMISHSWNADYCHDSLGQLACAYHCQAWTCRSRLLRWSVVVCVTALNCSVFLQTI